jgi:proteasome accessory factor B
MAVPKLERLLNLMALLLDTERPLSAEDIKDRLEAYAEDHAAFRRTFERDKEELRSMGIPISVEPVPGTLPAVDGYRIRREEYALRDPGLDAAELAALHLAASAVQVEGLPATDGLLKLGGLVGDGRLDDLGVHVAPLPADPNLPRLFAAVSARRPVAFRYHDEARTVDPYRLEFQRGRWYLTGYDHLREDERNFRLDRIDGDVEETDGPTFTPPATAVPGRTLGAWELGADEPVRARLRVEGPPARWAIHHLGPDHVVAEEDGGAVVVELPVTNRAAFRSFVLSFLDHAEVLEPEDLRRDVVEWLEALA